MLSGRAMLVPGLAVVSGTLAAAAGLAGAQPVLDGFRDAIYGQAVSLQTVQTGFGDGNPAGGSELDAAYSRVEGSTLYLMLTGNLENNFNNLNIFIDSRPGGQNVVQTAHMFGGNNPNNGVWAGKYAGFTFDAGFAADFLLILRNGNSGGNRFNIDYAVLGAGANAFIAATNVFAGSLTGSNPNALAPGFGVAFDNTNTGGVIGGSGAANQVAAAAATRGVELAIPLSVLDYPSGVIRVCAMINGSNHDFLSNQFLGGLPAPQINVGGDGAGGFNGSVGQIDLNDYAGNQWIEINLCPADLNGDGALNFFDVQMFLAAFAAHEPIGDYNKDGFFTFSDVLAFLRDFDAGCP